MKKSELYGIIGSAIFCGIVLLLLLLIVMPGRPTPEDEGIIVSFGNSFDGGGQSSATHVRTPEPAQPAEQPAQPVAPTPTQTERPAPTPPTSQDLLTQDDHSLALAQQQEEEQKKKELEALEQKKREEEQKLAEQKRREEEARIAEAKRQEEERLAEERRIAEQKRKEQEAIERANALGSMFGSGTSPEGSGSNEGNAHQGNPVGKGSSEGNSWSLDGRTLVGKLVTPSYNQNVEGIITVNIRVDENGNVSQPTIGRPTTISDAATQKATLEAARKTKFSAGKNVAIGTITYNFKLR